MCAMYVWRCLFAAAAAVPANDEQQNPIHKQYIP